MRTVCRFGLSTGRSGGAGQGSINAWTADALALMLTGAGTVAGVLFGVWQMQRSARQETATLRQEMNTQLADIRAELRTLNGRIDTLFILLADRGPRPMPQQPARGRAVQNRSAPRASRTDPPPAELSPGRHNPYLSDSKHPTGTNPAEIGQISAAAPPPKPTPARTA